MIRLLAALVLAPIYCWGQGIAPPPEFSAVPLPVGSGARALGQGGAFAAVADDATAAVWNPAGLVQLERPEASVVGTFLGTSADFRDGDVVDGPLTTALSFGSNEDDDRYDLNFLSVSYPLTLLRHNLVLSLNYHQRFDFHQELSLSKASTLADPFAPSTLEQRFDITSDGGIGALSPAVGVEVTPRLSVGVAVNFIDNEFFGGSAYEQTIRFTSEQAIDFSLLGLPPPIGTSSATFERRSEFDFDAVNATVGVMWRAWERGATGLTLGAVVETPFTADVDRHTRQVRREQIQDGMPLPDNVEGETIHSRVDFPLSATAAAALRLSDRTTIALDVTWTKWSDWIQENRDTGEKTRPIGSARADTEIDDTFSVRTGVEHLFHLQAGKVPLRAGLFYEPRPGLGNEQGIYGFSLGSGLTTARFSLDGAYQYREGNDLPGRNLSIELKDTTYDAAEHLLMLSLIVYR